VSLADVTKTKMDDMATLRDKACVLHQSTSLINERLFVLSVKWK